MTELIIDVLAGLAIWFMAVLFAQAVVAGAHRALDAFHTPQHLAQVVVAEQVKTHADVNWSATWPCVLGRAK